jgi:GMP synthase-like glutamine amidotransferase
MTGKKKHQCGVLPGTTFMTALTATPDPATEVDVAAAKLLVIQHDKKNGPGVISDLPCKTAVHRSDLHPKLPSLDGIGGLIVLGGPMASYSDENFASRKAEIALLQQAVERGLPVLGICLGAQLLAVALGARTYRRETPEIGYLPVALTDEGRQDRLFTGCPEVFSPRHKHFDSFELPHGAVRLASSVECVEQGFRYGDVTWGLQFHFEMDQTAAALALREPDVAASIVALAPTAQRILSNFCSIVRETTRSRVRTVSQ